MTEGRSGADSGVVRLRRALERLGGALARARVDELLTCEADLAAALAALSTSRAAESVDRRATLEEALAARAALIRCRRLGVGLGDYVRLTLDALGCTGVYGRTGGADVPAPGLSVNARG